MADRPDDDQQRLYVPIEEWSVDQPWDLAYHLRRIGALPPKDTGSHSRRGADVWTTAKMYGPDTP